MKKLILFFIFLLFSTVSFSQIVLKDTFCTIYYDTTLKFPIYTIHKIVCSDSNNLKRTNFIFDNRINSKYQHGTEYYKLLKGYDKGHLIPFEDASYNKLFSYNSMLYTNCVPQNSHLNRGLWKSIENYGRFLCENHDTVIAITYVEYNSNKFPSKFYKVYIYKNNKIIFVVENKQYYDKNIFNFKTNLIPINLFKLTNSLSF